MTRQDVAECSVDGIAICASFVTGKEMEELSGEAQRHQLLASFVAGDDCFLVVFCQTLMVYLLFFSLGSVLQLSHHVFSK